VGPARLELQIDRFLKFARTKPGTRSRQHFPETNWRGVTAEPSADGRYFWLMLGGPIDWFAESEGDAVALCQQLEPMMPKIGEPYTDAGEVFVHQHT